MPQQSFSSFEQSQKKKRDALLAEMDQVIP
jgi:hypothetical protein